MHGPYRIAGSRWWLRDDMPIEALRPGIETMLGALSRGQLGTLKQGRRKALLELQLAGDEPGEHLLKQNAHRGWARWRRRVLGSKSRLELERAEIVARRGLSTPVPLAAGERTRGGLLDTCWLLMRRVPDAIDLRVYTEGPPPSPRERRWLAEALGALTRSAVDSGLFHDDLAPNNVLVRRGPESELMMIDFERARVLERLSEAQVRRMLGKLDREMRGATNADRMRFLVSFSGDRARRWWRALAEETAVQMARDLSHLERSLGGGARRYVRFDSGERRGWRRKDQPLSALDPSIEPSAGSKADVGARATTRFAPTGRSEARRVLATAVLLFRRGLGPSPLGLVTTRTATHLVWDLPPCPPAALPARQALLKRLRALGRVDEREEGDIAGQEGPLGVQQGLWLAPQRFVVAGAKKGLRLRP